MKYISYKNSLKLTVLLISLSALPACEDFLEIPAPTNSVTGETVFLNKGTIDKLMNNMYYNWANSSGILHFLNTEALILTNLPSCNTCCSSACQWYPCSGILFHRSRNWWEPVFQENLRRQAGLTGLSATLSPSNCFSMIYISW